MVSNYVFDKDEELTESRVDNIPSEEAPQKEDLYEERTTTLIDVVLDQVSSKDEEPAEVKTDNVPNELDAQGVTRFEYYSDDISNPLAQDEASM